MKNQNKNKIEKILDFLSININFDIEIDKNGDFIEFSIPMFLLIIIGLMSLFGIYNFLF